MSNLAPDAIASPAAGVSYRSRLLVNGNALLLVAVSLHAGVTAVREWSGATGLPVQLWAAAATLLTIVLLALVLSRRNDPRAPAATMLAGFGAAFGGLLAHVGPPWGPLSQFSFWATGAHADAVSWVLLAGVVVIGLAVGTLGLMARSTSPGQASAGASI